MTTNKYPGVCEICGEGVPASKGTIRKVWDNYEDDYVWRVRHSDSGICQAVKSDREIKAKCESAYDAIVAYIRNFADKVDAAIYGEEVIIDRRKGYNQVGWIVTANNDNTIYLTSRNSLDGMDVSETYILAENEDDDHFGNHNTDIIKSLRLVNSGQPIDATPFEFA